MIREVKLPVRNLSLLLLFCLQEDKVLGLKEKLPNEMGGGGITHTSIDHGLLHLPENVVAVYNERKRIFLDGLYQLSCFKAYRRQLQNHLNFFYEPIFYNEAPPEPNLVLSFSDFPTWLFFGLENRRSILGQYIEGYERYQRTDSSLRIPDTVMARLGFTFGKNPASK